MSATGDGAAGFTLMEMLVVLAIAGLVAGIGFPRLQSQVTAQEWRTGVVAVTALLRTARAQAMRRDSVAVVSMGSNGRSLQVSDGPRIDLPASVTVALPAPLAFHGDGSASGGALAVIGSRRSARIAVTPGTGLAVVRSR